MRRDAVVYFRLYDLGYLRHATLITRDVFFVVDDAKRWDIIPSYW